MKNIASYLIAVVLSVLYMYFLDEESGLVITAIMLITPLISFIITFLSLRLTKIHVNAKTDIITCGDAFEAEIDIKRTLPIISPTVIIDFEVSANFNQYPSFSQKFSPQMNKESRYCVKITSKYATCGSVSVKSVKFSDFLGIFSLKSKCDYPEFKIAIIPKIIPSEKDNILFDSLALNFSYDDEQESSANAYSMHTSPGYEHREYVDSDPLKRINWKMSSKLGKLMVRLDEHLSASMPIFFIDLSANAEIAEILSEESYEQKSILFSSLYSRASKLLANVLGTLSYFTDNSIECKVFCTNLSKPVICENKADISSLAVDIAKASITDIENSRSLEDVFSDISEESSLVYCSFSRNPDIEKFLRLCKNKSASASVLLASSKTNADVSGVDAYYYNSDNALKRF